MSESKKNNEIMENSGFAALMDGDALEDAAADLA